MGFIEWFKKGSPSLLDMSEAEIRKEERFLQKDKEKMARQLQRLGAEREALFQRGAKSRDEYARKAVTLEYELKAQEITQVSREMLMKSKEILTLSRIRSLRRAGRSGQSSVLGRLTESDQVRLQRMVADAEINEELYTEKLDELLSQTERESSLDMALGTEGKRVLDIWQRMDDGDISTIDDAMKIAEIDRTEEEEEGPEPTKA